MSGYGDGSGPGRLAAGKWFPSPGPCAEVVSECVPGVGAGVEPHWERQPSSGLLLSLYISLYFSVSVFLSPLPISLCLFHIFSLCIFLCLYLCLC